jgi:tetratricopeptide (TPR) repeat protein
MIAIYWLCWQKIGYIISRQTLSRCEEALESLNKSIELNPLSSMAFSHKGEAFYCIGKYSEADEAFSSAIVLDQMSAEAWYGKGKALKMLNRKIDSDVAFAKARGLGYTD